MSLPDSSSRHRAYREREIRAAEARLRAPGCGRRKTSSAQLRYMRMLARDHRIDVGPACCAMHSQRWIAGAVLEYEDSDRNRQPKGAQAPVVDRNRDQGTLSR